MSSGSGCNGLPFDESEDPSMQNIPRSIAHLEQCAARVKAQLEHLNNVRVPTGELTSDFALPRTNELENERSRIRSSDLAHARQLAESYLMRLREAERRNGQQRQRLDVLETRTTLAESICTEQMGLNTELADESIRTLRQFVEAEKKRVSTIRAAKQRCESLSRELERNKTQRDQQEQTIGRLRDQNETLGREISVLNQQISKMQTEKNSLLLERDRLSGEEDSLRNFIAEQERTIEELRARESAAVHGLRERDALVESLAKERDEVKQDLFRTQKDCKALLAQRDTETDELIEQARKETEAKLKGAHKAEIEKFRQALRRQKSQFESAMQDALHETQRIAAQREEFYNNWRRVQETLDTYKVKLQAQMSRKMVNKCTELVRDLKDIGGTDNCTPTPRTLEPMDNVAQRYLDHLRESDSS